MYRFTVNGTGTVGIVLPVSVSCFVQGLSQQGVFLARWSTKNTYFAGSEFFLNINCK